MKFTERLEELYKKFGLNKLEQEALKEVVGKLYSNWKLRNNESKDKEFAAFVLSTFGNFYEFIELNK